MNEIPPPALPQTEQNNILTRDCPYRCGKCQWEYAWNYYDFMALKDTEVMPCGHEWRHLEAVKHTHPSVFYHREVEKES